MTNKSNTMPDPFADADNAKAQPFEYFGQVKANAQYLYFAGKGVKPIAFDAEIHEEDKRRVEVYLQIIPIAEQNISFDVYQKLLTYDRDWTTITNPSIRAIGVEGLRDLNDKWVRVARVEGTRKRLDRETGEDTGEKWQTFKFLELYPDEEACIMAFSGNRRGTPDTEYSASVNPTTPSDTEKLNALAFAKVVVANAGRSKHGNREAFEAEVERLITEMPLISKVLSITSPEIVELLEKEVKEWES